MEKDKEQVLLGSLLGDGSLRCSGKMLNPVYSEEHCLAQSNYIIWKNSILQFNECMVTRTDNRRKGPKTYQQHCIYSNASSELLKFHNLFYGEGKKQVTREILEGLNKLGIAVWYCDDGSYNYWTNQIYLCTNGFSETENKLIIAFFNNNYNINFSYSCKRLVLYKKEAMKFVNIIKDIVPECMQYKLGYDIKKQIKAKEKKSDYEKNRRPNKEKRKEYFKEYRKNNKEKAQAHHKKYYQEHRTELLKNKAQYYQKNKEKILVDAEKYRQENKEKIVASRRRYYQKHKEEIKSKMREQYKKTH